jgi:hypothetical protein
MFDIPGFDPHNMSEDELLTRQGELSRRLSFANRFSSSGEMADQIMRMIQTIEAVRRDRVLKIMFDERNKMFPEIIETEPELAAEHKRKITDNENDERMATRRKVGRERLTLTKSSSPPSVQPHIPVKSDQPQNDEDDVLPDTKE